MNLFHFGRAGRRMVGTWHAPEIGATGTARRILVIAPFGQEEMRSRRLFRVVAERLVRLGHGVLRFDRYGCGDADGADEDGDLAGWVGDVLEAARELERRCPGADEVWLGARLGASLALQAAAQCPSPRCLALWEPVLDGPAYLRDLQQSHVAALEAMNASPDPRWRLQLGADAAAFADEAMGFRIDARLRRQIAELQPAALPVPADAAAIILASTEEPARAAWRASQPGAVQVREAPPFEWTSDRAINSALVPAEAVQAIVRAVDA